jgi:hypothetical protein
MNDSAEPTNSSTKASLKDLWEYARGSDCLYTGWASPSCTNKFHYFIKATSLCKKHEHFARPSPDHDLHWVPKHPKIPTCKICLKRYYKFLDENGIDRPE